VHPHSYWAAAELTKKQESLTGGGDGQGFFRRDG
jgi:hypothetical protein